MKKSFLLFGVMLAACPLAAEVITTPRPVPATRPAMKELLEDMKTRPLRFPLPELTAEDREKLGESVDRYESRLKYHYLPYQEQRQSSTSGRSSNETSRTRSRSRSRSNSDENMTLSYPFKTMLFWVVSRTNNCQYCLGHQEQKLIATGMTEDQVAALDADWSQYSPAEQAAFAYARKLTYEPHLLNDADFESLRKHYNDLQILEMTMSVARNNATNRWKEGTGIPQSSSGIRFFTKADGSAPSDPALPIESYLTPTSQQFRNVISRVAPLALDESGQPTGQGFHNRPALETPEILRNKLEAAKTRTPRLPVLDEKAARAALGENAPSGKLPLWVRLVATFPNASQRRMEAILQLDEPAEVDGDLTPLMKAQIRWIVARQDRAWYVTAQAERRLKELGQSQAEINALDHNWEKFDDDDRALFTFARKQAMTPIAVTDVDAAQALEQNGPRTVVQLIDFVTGCVYLNRVSEAANLPAIGD